ncbi:hypothetical protein ES702_00136 [subsurface metagenome]
MALDKQVLTQRYERLLGDTPALTGAHIAVLPLGQIPTSKAA